MSLLVCLGCSQAPRCCCEVWSHPWHASGAHAGLLHGQTPGRYGFRMFQKSSSQPFLGGPFANFRDGLCAARLRRCTAEPQDLVRHVPFSCLDARNALLHFHEQSDEQQGLETLPTRGRSMSRLPPKKAGKKSLVETIFVGLDNGGARLSHAQYVLLL